MRKAGVPEELLNGSSTQEDYLPDTGLETSASGKGSEMSAAAGMDPRCPASAVTLGSWHASDGRGVRLRRGCQYYPEFGWRKAYYKHGRTKNAIKNDTKYTYKINRQQPNFYIYSSRVNKIQCRIILGCRVVDSREVRTTVKFTTSSYIKDHYSLGVGTSYCVNPGGANMCPSWAKNPGPY